MTAEAHGPGEVAKRLDGGAYTSIKIFWQDIMQMCQNARKFNYSTTYYFKAAERLERDFAAMVLPHLL